MKNFDAIEQSYNNGYKEGYQKAIRELSNEIIILINKSPTKTVLKNEFFKILNNKYDSNNVQITEEQI